MVTNAEVLRYLTALDFPATKDDIVAEAEREGASDDVLRALRAMPPADYGNINEVARSARTNSNPEVTPADLAARARDRKHQRVARHLRQS
ncbi:DUF2795 domain-containing protein [Micromonospora sp. NBC_01796]|uniref:DUF2795 domain-containing protein n=1 Tax=Micromonospora sp. NBC_01796 TaxID=2975987 RepID=UPI002DDB11FD|nr:DUF2795 domain-containing protein [Micromonospora sp. NBC_01796]WSA84894.1 DUF2795 domain-containing protein [Micromonospora sp. NBC_01796]